MPVEVLFLGKVIIPAFPHVVFKCTSVWI